MKKNKLIIKSEKKLPDLSNMKDVLKILQEPTVVLAEFLTGALSSGPSNYILSAGKVVQAAIRGKFLNQLGRELKEYRDKGKIKKDYFASNKTQATLLELLQFIEVEIPNEELLKALKSIFLNMVSIEADSNDEEVGYQLFLLCKKLNAMDILILKICYNVYTEKDLQGINTGITSHGDWVEAVSTKIGYGLPELVHNEDDKLVEMGLLSGRSYTDKSGIRPGKDFRLTKLGIKLCEYITGWDVK